MLRAQQAKLVLNRVLDQLKGLRLRGQTKDDSVEAQAETLRIWMWASSAGLALIVVATIASRGGVEDSTGLKREPEIAMADQLPSGFVLVPIEPTNLDSLDSVFGHHGYADLYRADGSQQRGHRLERGVALVRSPRNPRKFAVLLPESESANLSALAEPVLVILRKGPLRKDEHEESPVPSKKRTRVIRKVDLIEEGQPDMITLNTTGENL